MVTSIGGVPFGSILYIDGVSINDIVSYMGTTITLPDYLYVGGNFTTYQQPIYNRIIRTIYLALLILHLIWVLVFLQETS